MINPNDVADAVAATLVANKTTLGITDASVIAEDADVKPMRPPHAGVFADFEYEAGQQTSDTTQICVPVEIKILCFSTECKTAALAFAEAFGIAVKIVALMKGVLTVGSDEVTLKIRKKPFEILRNSAEQSVVQVNVYYELTSVGE
ncbi:MAG: hypothetical protein AB1728_13305 [Bacteroidota bacterium]